LAATQEPFWQICPVAQALPHDPQLEELLLVSVQMPLHLICPVGQPQIPFRQLTPVSQTFPQEPQLLRSLLVSVHLPLQNWPPSQGFSQPVQDRWK